MIVGFAGNCFAYNETEYIRSLLTRGDDLVNRVNGDMGKFHNESNYFLKAIQDEMQLLTSVLTDLRKALEGGNDPVNQAFISQAEIQLTQHENNMKDLLIMAETNGADPTYKLVCEMLDNLLTRSYQDIGNLVTHNNNLDMSKLMNEVRNVEVMEKTLKSIDYKHTPDQAQIAIEQLLEHERVIELELYKLEQIIHK